ncbi:hypothetical protein EAI_03060, partial [Harpegnathos saltator]
IPIIQETSTAIPADEYKKCFEKFVERFQRCIDSQGD